MAIKKFDLTKVYKPREEKHRTDRGYHTPQQKETAKTSVSLDWNILRGKVVKPDFTFSVVMPVYNARSYVVTAMESVIGQDTNESLELIVVDDCSTDGSYELIEDFARKHPSTSFRCITILRNNKNSGVAFSRNQGIAYATGEYIAFLDADDWWDAAKLRLQYEHLIMRCEKITAAKERAELVGKKLTVRYPVLSCTARELADVSGTPMQRIIPVPDTITYKMNLKTNYIPCSSVLIRRSVAQEFPMYRDDMHEDYITWLKVLKKYGPAVGLNRPLLYYRLSPQGKSRNKFKSAKMQYKCYRYMKIGPVKSLWYLLNYMVEGINKYQDFL